jgi:hypothetical protein
MAVKARAAKSYFDGFEQCLLFYFSSPCAAMSLDELLWLAMFLLLGLLASILATALQQVE